MDKWYGGKPAVDSDASKLREWLDEDSCARCGYNKPVVGYEWCAECRPELAKMKT